jgi:type IV pilus assembly protein PilM
LRRAAVNSALAGHAVIVKRLSMPAMSTAELTEAIPWEAEQYIPFDLADVQLDYQVLTQRTARPARTATRPVSKCCWWPRVRTGSTTAPA